METLYALTHNFEELFDSYDAIYDIEYASDGKGGYVDDDGNPVDPAAVREEMQQAWFDTLDAMECEITDKAKNVALYIKNITAEAEAIDAEKKRLEARLKRRKNSIDHMKKYLGNCLEAAKLKKIDLPEVLISIRNNPESTVILYEKKFIEWAMENNDDLLKFSDPEISKTAVKQFIKSGGNVPYAGLIRTKSIIIK